MLRSLRLLAVSAVLFAAACGDKDDDFVSNLVANGVQLTTTEDTPVSGNIPVTGNKGRVRASVTSGPAHGELVVTGTAFTYTPAADYSGEDKITVSVSDDEKTVSGLLTITITPVNDPPRITTQELTVAEDTSIMINAAALGVTDPDSAGPFTVTVANNGSYLVDGNSVTPLPNFNGTLAVNVTLSDGEASAEAAVTVIVTPVNDAPVVVVPAPQNAPNAEPFAVTGVTVSDIDAGASPVSITLSANVNATVSVATIADLTFTEGDGTTDTRMTFTGTLTAVNAALATLTIATATPNVAVTVTFTANDRGATGVGDELSDTDELVVGFGSANLPPFNTVPNALTTSEDVALVITGISVDDADAASGATLTIVLTVTHGTLTLSGTTGLSGVTGLTTASVTFTGTIANVNAAMNGMTYTPSANYAGADTLTISTTSSGLNDTDVVGMTINAVNDAPTITGPTLALNTTPSSVVAFTGGNAIAVNDIDAGEASVKVTVTTSEGAFAANGPTVDTSTPGTVVFIGTLAAVNTDLASGQWTAPASSGNGRTVTFVIDDQGATGSGGNRTATRVVTIHVAETAVLGASNDNYTAQGNVRRIVVGGSSGKGVLNNDANATAVTSLGPITTDLSGTVTMTADGGFTYTPPVGIGGRQGVPPPDIDPAPTDFFDYTVTGAGGGTATARVNIKLFRVIWFVNANDTGSLQTGTFEEPFATIGQAITATGTSHYGTYIYVYNAPAAYTVDAATMPSGTSLIGSRYAFDLQDGDTEDGYSETGSTVIPESGMPTIRPVNATALRIGDTSRITGFKFVTGVTTTGPAIQGIENNSGVIDNDDITGFNTAIAFTDPSSDGMQVDNLNIVNASTAGISVVTGKASGLIIVNVNFRNVGNGLIIDANPGADTHGRLGLTMASCSFTRVAQHGIRVESAAGPDATEESFIRLSNMVVTNSPADPVASGAALTINTELGQQRVELSNVFIAGYRSGVSLAVQSAATIAVFDTIELNGIGPANSYADSGIRIGGVGAGAGSLDLTATALTGSTGSTAGLVLMPNAVATCLDLTNSHFVTAAGTDGLQLIESGVFSLEGYSGGSVADYFATPPARFTGVVASAGTFTGRDCSLAHR